MEQAYFSASQLLSWINKIHLDKNREQFTEFYGKLPDILSSIFRHWCDYSCPDLLVKILELLSPRYENNLFSAVMREESTNFHIPFPFANLPVYVQNILKKRRLSDLPAFYRVYNVVLDKEIIVLPIPQYFFFTFMFESCRNRQAEWFEGYSFLEYMYSDPFLVLFSHYLQDLSEDLVKYLSALSQEYIMKDCAYKLGPAPSRHNCEMLLVLTSVLQRPFHLLLPSFRIININPDATLLSLTYLFYEMFKNLTLNWEPGYNTYCSYLIEIWLQVLTPWKQNEYLARFMSSEYLPMPCKVLENPYKGDEAYWEEYINYHILLYTECFPFAVKLISSEMLFRAGDIDIILRISEIFSLESEESLFNQCLNLNKLKQWSKGAPAPLEVESVMKRFSVNRAALVSFLDSDITALAENLIYKAANLGYAEANEIKRNWVSLLGIRNKVLAKESAKKQLKVNMANRKSMLNVWDKPIRSDELLVLYLVVKYLSWAVDRIRKKERKWPPETDLRFFASYTNLLFLLLVYFLVNFIVFR